MIKKLLKNIFKNFIFENNIEKIEKYLAQSSNTYDLEHKIFELDKKGKYNQIYL